MSLQNEDYFEASKYYPITYETTKYPRKPQNYLEAIQTPFNLSSNQQFPHLPPGTSSQNIFAHLSQTHEDTDTIGTSRNIPYNTKPHTPKSNYPSGKNGHRSTGLRFSDRHLK